MLDEPLSALAGAPHDDHTWACPQCGTHIVHPFRAGRKRVYCTNACKHKAYRWRRDHGVRILSTPWKPAGRSHNDRTHAVRHSSDYVGARTDERGRSVTVCGAFGRRIRPGNEGGHTEFVPGAASACRSCIRLIGADPAWTDQYPLVEMTPGSIVVRYRPPAERREQYLADRHARRQSDGARLGP